MSLQDSVTSSTETIELQTTIIRNLWKHNTQAPSWDSKNWNAFFSYYTDECKSALEDQGDNVTIRTHQDILSIAKQLETGWTKESICKELLAYYAQRTQTRSDTELAQMIEGSIRLAVRLVAMVDIGPVSPRCIQGYTPLDWADDRQNLRIFLGEYFTPKASVADFLKFGALFNALNLERYAGLKIHWTDNLNNHLRLVNEDTVLCIFHHVTFLRSSRRWVRTERWQYMLIDDRSTIYPVGFLEETLRTLLELLFPSNDMANQKWLRREACSKTTSTHLDSGLQDLDRLKPYERTLDNFTFWRDELIELKERFEQPHLTSISQLWYDRRNRSQWITFWFGLVIAFATLLTLILGVFQTILGALQVYNSYDTGVCV